MQKDLFTGCFVCGVWMNHVWALALEVSGFSVFTRAGATKHEKSALEKRGRDDVSTMWAGHFAFAVLRVAWGVLAFVLLSQSVGLFLWSNSFQNLAFHPRTIRYTIPRGRKSCPTF